MLKNMEYLNQNVRPYTAGWVDVGKVHRVYYECYGNRQGIPAIVLHGGPGYYMEKEMLMHFDLSKWQVILYDQRGCGKSRPKGSVTENTTQALISDINSLSNHLGIERFVIKGESWGTTLALAYAQQNPGKVLALVLNGVFLGERDESMIGRMYGIEKFFPDFWERMMSLLTEEEQRNPYESFCKYVLGDYSSKQREIARTMIVLELMTESLDTTCEKAENICSRLDYVNIAKIECHFTIHDFFLEEEQIISQCYLIENIPVFIVQGRYDMIVPVKSAWRLHKKLKKSKIFIIEESGHSSYEEKTSEQLSKIFQELVVKLK